MTTDVGSTMVTSPVATGTTSPKPKGRWRGLLTTALWGTLALASMVLGVVALVNSGLDIFKVQSVVSQLRWVGVALQVLFVALIGMRWRALVRWGQRRNMVQPHEVERAMAFRPKAMVFLCAYLVLIPIGPQTLFRLLGLI
ncbi:MAG: hypothetical protein Q8S96_12545 [Hydrogenophaga sp.]|uniref:hypothetical protein n=1 Tax=Hydrogenophaga sp. TaxID=1904254 RepID=UPI00271E74B1|nr:hypothetical protein [Hydrogenophaga sp.]MDO9480160.1 hypothetical protein [Hydrogenophaga sp.]MDP3345267.1 hypothetical protein [Hydrogenophaga sp.]MDP3922693.1 hypothetical protein [Hydrogenophaga sp.]